MTEDPKTQNPETPEPDAPAAQTPVEPAPAVESPAAPQDDTTSDAGATPAAEAPEPATVPAPVTKRARTRARRAKVASATAGLSPQERRERRLAERSRKAAQRRAHRLKQRNRPRSEPAAALEPVDTRAREPKQRQGLVVSDKADKTIVVRIDLARRHRRYKKIVRSSVTLHAHDETNDARAGDKVVIAESRPLSATKRWRLVSVLERAR